jgi:hypothetical protein
VKKSIPCFITCILLLILSSASLLTAAEAKVSGEACAAAVEAFMNARLLEHNVAARNLMTANLENAYLRSKKLSVRVKSGRIVTYDFDPAKITHSGEKEFNAEITSLWADLNEQVFETQREKIKFLMLRGEWLADEIELLKKDPLPGLPPVDLEVAKQMKYAATVAKKFAKAIINRNPASIVQLTSQEFQARYKSPEELIAHLCSGENPRYSAFDVRNYQVKDPQEISFQVRFYRITQGKRGGELVEAEIVTKEGSLDWSVVDYKVGTVKSLS